MSSLLDDDPDQRARIAIEKAFRLLLTCHWSMGAEATTGTRTRNTQIEVNRSTSARWSRRRESNPLVPPYQGGAPPQEHHRQFDEQGSSCAFLVIGDSNPTTAFSHRCYPVTQIIGSSVEQPGIAPGLLRCERSVFLLDYCPLRHARLESNQLARFWRPRRYHRVGHKRRDLSTAPGSLTFLFCDCCSPSSSTADTSSAHRGAAKQAGRTCKRICPCAPPFKAAHSYVFFICTSL